MVKESGPVSLVPQGQPPGQTVQTGKLSSGHDVSTPPSPDVDTSGLEKAQHVSETLVQPPSKPSAALPEISKAPPEGITKEKIKEKALELLPQVTSKPPSQEELAHMLQEQGLEGAKVDEILAWHKENFGKIAHPDWTPRPPIPISDPNHVTPLKGLKYFTDPDTGKVHIQIALERFASGGVKTVKTILTITPEGIIREARYAPHKEGGVSNKKEFLIDAEKEYLWRKRIEEAEGGVLPETITKFKKITYTSLKTGEERTRYVGELCEGSVHSLLYLTPVKVASGSSATERQITEEPVPEGEPSQEELLEEKIPQETAADRSEQEAFEQKMRFMLGCYLDTLSALEILHKHGIVHGDLKAENILFKNGMAKLHDFGGSAYYGTPVTGGSVGYTAPEIFDGIVYSDKSDMFSMGMMLLEIMNNEDFTSFALMQATVRQMLSAESPATYEDVRAKLAECKAFIEEKRTELQFLNNPLLNLISDLIKLNPEERPTSQEAHARLQEVIQINAYIL